ncbi:MAG: glycine zipper 2TM domain-containing protein [Verrucomicrobiota bacterium]
MSRGKRISLVTGLLAGVMLFVSCTTDPYVQRGRVGGAVVGGATGAIIGNNVRGGSSWGGAAIGAAVGGLAGDRIGRTNSMYYRSRYGPTYFGTRYYRRGYYGPSVYARGFYGVPRYSRSRFYRYY